MKTIIVVALLAALSACCDKPEAPTVPAQYLTALGLTVGELRYHGETMQYTCAYRSESEVFTTTQDHPCAKTFAWKHHDTELNGAINMSGVTFNGTVIGTGTN